MLPWFRQLLHHVVLLHLGHHIPVLQQPNSIQVRSTQALQQEKKQQQLFMVLAGAGEVGGLGQQAGGHLHHQGGDQVLQGQVQGSQQGPASSPLSGSFSSKH